MKLFYRMLILVAGALHLPLLLPERGQVAQARYGIIALEILPFLQGLFLPGVYLFVRHHLYLCRSLLLVVRHSIPTIPQSCRWLHRGRCV